MDLIQLIQQDKLDQASSEATRRLKKSPGDLDAKYALALIHLSRKDFSRSCLFLKEVCKARPNDAICAGNLGVAYMRQHLYLQAISTLRKAIEINPSYEIAKYNLACCLIESSKRNDGNIDEASALLEELTKDYPDNANYLCTYADTLRLNGFAKKAIEAYEKCIGLFPTFARAYVNLAALLMHFAQYEDAMSRCSKVLKFEPSAFLAHRILGECSAHMEDLDGAMDAYADAYEINPQSADLCAAIGKVWNEVGNEPEASIWFYKAKEIDHECIPALCGLAAIQSDDVEHEAAIAELTPALEKEPDNIDLHLTMGDIYWEAGEAENAKECFNNALRLDPNRLTNLIKLASIESSAGNIDKAASIYQQALEINPNFSYALSGLASTLKKQLPTNYVAKIHELIKNNRNLKDGALAALHSGLAFYYDDLKDPHLASEHMKKANDLQWGYRSKRGWEYEPKQFEQHVDRLIDLYDQDFMSYLDTLTSSIKQHIAQVAPKITPVFIVSMPRSGTTLTEQILARHSQVLGLGERTFAHQSFQGFYDNDMLSDKACFKKSSTSEYIQEACDRYLELLQRLVNQSGENGITHIVDKMPDNYLLLGWILTLFPNAKIIHIKRDPRAVALSCWLTQFGSIQWACHEEHIVHRIQQYQRIMTHWQEVLPNQFYELNYEDLVSDQSHFSQELIEFLELDWEEECLTFYESEHLIRTASITQVRQPVYKQSVAKWQRYEPYIPALFKNLR